MFTKSSSNPYKKKFDICINMGLGRLINVRNKDLLKHLDNIIYHNLKCKFLDNILTFEPLQDENILKKIESKDHGFYAQLTLIFGDYTIGVCFIYERLQKKIYMYTNDSNTPVYYITTIKNDTSFKNVFNDLFNIDSERAEFFTIPINEIDRSISDYVSITPLDI